MRARCAALVARYLDVVHGYVRRYSVRRPTPPTPASPAKPSPLPVEPPGQKPSATLLNPAPGPAAATGLTPLSDPTEAVA